MNRRTIVWFSCGAASACALKLMAPSSPLGIYCDTSASEDPDNQRFLKDVSAWTGIQIQVIKSEKFTTVEQVFESRRYMSGQGGAPCTVELKKKPRFAFQQPDDLHVFGYTSEEKKRANKFALNNHELFLYWPLIEKGMTKESCHQMLKDAGIERPRSYRLGFKNANCPGCVKATSPSYWNAIRRHYPEVFASRCEQSRRFGARLVRVKGKRIFLDELAPDDLTEIEEDLSCGPHCGVPEAVEEEDFWA